jgi:small subunit ribosomal protein S1
MAHPVSVQTTKSASSPIMADQISIKDYKIIHLDELVEGFVISIEPKAVYIDIPLYGTGVILGREFQNTREVIKNLNIGDSIKAKVVDTENEDGYIELSLKEARQAIIWKEADEAVRNKTSFILPVKAANKGGLIIEWQGVEGFLPASQLSEANYPSVNDGNKDSILRELKKLAGKNITVTIISSNAKEGKLIFSEKGIVPAEKADMLMRYTVGDDVETTVSGLVDFGVFLKIEEGLEGLVHISEIDWALVDDTRKLFKVGDKVRARIIEIKDGKISLSIKALKNNPWKNAANQFKKDDTVAGVVIRINKHGALVSIQEGVSGLVHNSDFKTEEELKKNLELGKSYQFKITVFEPKDQRMALSFVGDRK